MKKKAILFAAFVVLLAAFAFAVPSMDIYLETGKNVPAARTFKVFVSPHNSSTQLAWINQFWWDNNIETLNPDSGGGFQLSLEIYDSRQFWYDVRVVCTNNNRTLWSGSFDNKMPNMDVRLTYNE